MPRGIKPLAAKIVTGEDGKKILGFVATEAVCVLQGKEIRQTRRLSQVACVPQNASLWGGRMTAKLDEFVAAQEGVYGDVVRELTAGEKRSHWMWFIFPQLAGLGASQMARKFAIGSLVEAQSYLQHPVLGPRLKECTRLMLAASDGDVSAILGYPDDLKFRSCMTLFVAAEPTESLFQKALDKFFGGEPDSRTLELLDAGKAE